MVQVFVANVLIISSCSFIITLRSSLVLNLINKATFLCCTFIINLSCSFMMQICVARWSYNLRNGSVYCVGMWQGEIVPQLDTQYMLHGDVANRSQI